MAQASTHPAASLPVAASPRAALRSPSRAGGCTGDLMTRLSIAAGQEQAWKAFADALSVNKRRMRADNAGGESPFGPLAHRLDALASMQRAAQQLFAILDPTQRRVAMQVLPLCCLREAPEIQPRPAPTLGGS